MTGMISSIINWRSLSTRPRAAARVVRAVAFGATLAVLPACSLLGKSEPDRDTFEITVPHTFAARGGTGAQILVKEPNALKAVDSDRIIVKTAPNTITYLAGAQWSDTVPRMMQAKLVEAFENTGATRATAKPGDGLVIDYQLVGDIRRFEVVDGLAVIEMSIKLLSDRSGRVRDTRIFTATAAATDRRPEGYVRAFDRAFAVFAGDVVNWVLGTV